MNLKTLRKLNEELRRLLRESIHESHIDGYGGEESDFDFKVSPKTLVYSDQDGFSPWTSIGQLEDGTWVIFENGYREEDCPSGGTKEEALQEWVQIVCSDFESAEDFFDFFTVEDDDLVELVYKYFED